MKNLDYRNDRYSSQPIYIETFHELFIHESDMFLIFNIEEKPTLRWVIEDHKATGTVKQFTRVICIDEETGEIPFNHIFADVDNDGLITNNFYAILVEYVTLMGYEIGQLLVDIQVPEQLGSYYENGALVRMSWHTFKNIDVGVLKNEIRNQTVPPTANEGSLPED